MSVPISMQFGNLFKARREYFVLAVAFGASIVIGVAIGFLRSFPAENKAPPKDTWVLPPMPARAPVANPGNPDDFADMFWSEEPRAKRAVQPKQVVVNWRFIGTFKQGAQLYAIIADDKRVQAFKAGDKMPNGVVIKAIQEGDIVFEQDGAEKTRRLYSKDSGQ